MAKKFTQLPVATTPLDGNEIIAIVQGGVSKRTTIGDLPTGGGGTVTNFSSGNLSPLFTTNVADSSTTPALTFSLSTQNANKVFAGPTNGVDAAPTFRALVAADIPDISATYYLASNPSGYTSNTGTVTSVGFTGGLISVANATITPAFTVAGTSGGIPYFSSASTWASSAALAANAIVIGGGSGNAPSTTTTGTGVLTALGVNVGSSGAFVVNGGALGTPSSGTLTNATGLPISTGVSGLGTGVATFLGTPSWANFNSMITGTAPYWALTGTSTLTGSTTITSNANGQHNFDGTWTATANNQSHFIFNPTITTRSGQTGDIVRGMHVAGSFTAGTGSNAAIMSSLSVSGTWNDNGTSGAVHSFLRVFDGTATRFHVTDANSVFGSGSNTLTITNGVAGPQLSSSSGSLQMNSTSASGNVLMQIASNSWFGVQASNSIGASLFAVAGTVSSTATQTSSRRLNWQVGEYTGSAAQTNYWTAKANQSTTVNQSSTWDLSFGTTGSAPSETNLHLRVQNGTGNVLLGAGTSTTLQPVSRLEIRGSFGPNLTSVSATTTLDDTHHTVLVDATGGARTINLPAASGCTRRVYIVKKIDASVNAVTLDGNSSETIDGATTYALALQYEYVKIQSDGTNWFIIGND